MTDDSGFHIIISFKTGRQINAVLLLSPTWQKNYILMKVGFILRLRYNIFDWQNVKNMQGTIFDL